ncbi:general negative regulator of transcription subunit 5 [Binucleata daphniae]
MKKTAEIKKDDKKDDKNVKTIPKVAQKTILTKPVQYTKDQTLTPAEVWAKATKMLDKTKEAPKKEEKQKTFDFSDIENKISMLNKENVENMIDNGYIYKLDYEAIAKQEEYIPDTPYTGELDFFPTVPLVEFEGPEIYKKIDLDTLFYIFYTRPGTLRQFYAAKELKNYSWRFHTKYMTWFQRLEEPKIITEEYEQGVFLFFDFDVTWGNRKKKDFTFEYKYLENNEI